MMRTSPAAFLATAALLLAFTAAHAADPSDAELLKESWAQNPLVKDPKALLPLRKDVLGFGCEINLCFVLDGTWQVSADQFADQQSFSDLILAITTTDQPANYCAVHYNDFFTRISPRTPSADKFLKRLYKAKKIRPQSRRINVGRGFRYVANQLLDRGKVANKIVIFSKGGRGLGRSARNVSRYFQRNEGGICGVVVGDGSTKQLQNITPGIVVNFDGFFELSEVVTALVADLCGVPCGGAAESC